jgi:hypothetical protein
MFNMNSHGFALIGDMFYPSMSSRMSVAKPFPLTDRPITARYMALL